MSWNVWRTLEKKGKRLLLTIFLDCDYEKETLCAQCLPQACVATHNILRIDRQTVFSVQIKYSCSTLWLAVYSSVPNHWPRKFQSFNPLFFSSEISSLPLPLPRHVPNSGRRKKKKKKSPEVKFPRPLFFAVLTSDARFNVIWGNICRFFPLETFYQCPNPELEVKQNYCSLIVGMRDRYFFRERF